MFHIFVQFVERPEMYVMLAYAYGPPQNMPQDTKTSLDTFCTPTLFFCCILGNAIFYLFVAHNGHFSNCLSAFQVPQMMRECLLIVYKGIFSEGV